MEDDFTSLDFVRHVGMSAPIFTICKPYKGTDMWRMCVERGYLDESDADVGRIGEPGRLRCFTPREQAIQERACYLGPLYCMSPDWLARILAAIIRAPLPRLPLRYIGFGYTSWHAARTIFPQAIPRSPAGFFRLALDSVRYII
jgi:hypothetical protein